MALHRSICLVALIIVLLCESVRCELKESDVQTNIPACPYANRLFQSLSGTDSSQSDSATYVTYTRDSIVSRAKTQGVFKDLVYTSYSVAGGELYIYDNTTLVYSSQANSTHLWTISQQNFTFTASDGRKYLAVVNPAVFTVITSNKDLNCSVACCKTTLGQSVYFNGTSCNLLQTIRTPLADDILWPSQCQVVNATTNQFVFQPCASSIDRLPGSCAHGSFTPSCGCSCVGNWIGSTCNNCPDLKCIHGVQDYDSCTCKCTENTFWDGERCEQCGLVNTTSSASCSYYGVPIFGSPNWNCTSCDCFGGWKGAKCNICPIDCGPYSDTDANCTRCVCENGWIGTHCETCSMTCTKGYVDPSCSECVCPGLWTGQDCTECSIDCNGHGTFDSGCTSCTCTGGWQGRRCERKCGNGVLESGEACDSAVGCSTDCTRILNGYKCVNGTNCKDIDECADSRLNKCDKLATCTNTDGSYTCTCPPPPTKCRVKSSDHATQSDFAHVGTGNYAF